MTKAELQKKLKDAKARLETSRGVQRLSLKRNILNLENKVKNFVATPAVKPSNKESRTGRSASGSYYKTAKEKEEIKKEKEKTKAPTSTEKAADKMKAVANARPKIKQGGSNTTTAAQRKTAVESAGYKLKEKKKSYGESGMGHKAYQNLNFKRRK